MWRAAGTLLLSCSLAVLHAQSREVGGCSTQMEYAPVLVANPDHKVTFKCSKATPLDLMKAVGRQTRTPIGIVLGRNTDALTKEPRPYDLEGVTPETALREAAEDANYTLKQEGLVWVLVAVDATFSQNSLLSHRYPDFPQTGPTTMVEMGVMLTMWMQAASHPEIQSFMGSIGGSTNDEKLTLKVPPSSSTEEIANAVASLGSKGIWILRAAADNSDAGLNDKVEIEPYQHYSNRPNIQ